MPTVINNPVPVRDSNNWTGFFLGVIILVILAILLFRYAVPYISLQRPSVNIPGKIDVNIHTNGK